MSKHVEAPLILASASPRRRDLLDQMGISYEVVPAHLDETAFRHRRPGALVRALAHAKAGAVRHSIPGGAARWILAADTVVVVRGRILGKPADAVQARDMIRQLSDQKHRVITGVAVWPAEAPAPTLGVASTAVSFGRLTDDEIDIYIRSGDWHDVAGGYRIQGRAALHITSISGSYSNVVGLPIHLVYTILTGHGYRGFPSVAQSR